MRILQMQLKWWDIMNRYICCKRYFACLTYGASNLLACKSGFWQIKLGKRDVCVTDSRFFFFFWANSSNHCLAALDLGACAEQPFDCRNVQNHQAVQSMRRSMDWTLEDNMVDGLFFCATLTGRRGCHIRFVQAGTETSDTSAEAVKPDPCCSWRAIPRGAGVGDGNAESSRVVRPPRIPYSAPHVCCYQINWWVVCGGYKWASRFEAPCICTR